MRLKLTVLVLLASFQEIFGQAYHLKFYHSPEEHFACEIIEDYHLLFYRGFDTQDEKELKYFINPAITPVEDNWKLFDKTASIVEVFSRERKVAKAFMESMCKSVKKVEPYSKVGKTWTKPEVRKIVDGGDQGNRIDVVFMGDGYTISEKEKFFNDVQRLTRDMFEGPTFRSYLPLFNIWAIYVESEESGIGYNGPKNTPFGLQRVQGQLRVVYPEKPGIVRAVCTLTGPYGCDFPSIIANDDFYGGVGGEFVVSTRSERTGTLVLRHEMGHNFVHVGDEYDNSPVYVGVNSATSVDSLSWTAWLTGYDKREERAVYRLLKYPWADLSIDLQTFDFTSDGTYSRWSLVVSVSAAGEEDCLEFALDGNILPWKSSGHDDREFYTWFGDIGFSAGTHNFSVRSKTSSTHPHIPRMICHVWLHEYGREDEFHSANNYVSAYPTFGENGIKYFRPTNSGCLMRNLTHNQFCPVCQEGMWMQFLQRISLIDNITISKTAEINGMRSVTVSTLKLGQFRAAGNKVHGETLEVKWFRNEKEKAGLRNNFTIIAETGSWTVEVHLNTPEVRTDPKKLLTCTQTFIVP